MKEKIAIIGAGVIGLSTGIRLLEKGFSVSIFARDFDQNMASIAAPAIWSPYKAAPEKDILRWAQYSSQIYQNLPKESGVHLIELVEYHHPRDENPLFTKIRADYRKLASSELPAGYTDGFAKQISQIDTSIYMAYLMNWFKQLGGLTFQQHFKAIEEVDLAFDTIINCCGVWSTQLVGDKESYPIRGQYLIVDKPPGLEKAIFGLVDDQSYILIVPRIHDCYLGGTTINFDWDMTVNDQTSDIILKRAGNLEPLLKNVQIKKAGVGLRPGRRSIRIESEKLSDGRTVIHHYGHGGSGFTVSWGCAEEVIKLLSSRAG